jgi:TfoX/Sxy family transcriptional regulator of competence genes
MIGMPWPKPSAEKTQLLEHTLSGMGERRQLFGAPCWFTGGNMFTGVFGEDIFIRLSEADRAEASRAGAMPFQPVKGRTMREYAILPAALLAEATLTPWLKKSYTYTSSLPAKPTKK